MKRITSILSACGVVLALSLPSWAQTTLPTHNVTLAGTVETIELAIGRPDGYDALAMVDGLHGARKRDVMGGERGLRPAGQGKG